MFDVDLPGGESYRESRTYEPGRLAVLADLPWGPIGLTICYDLRFPYLYRALAKAGARFLAIPAAFTRVTGQAHWHTLVRARAIEAQCFVLRRRAGGGTSTAARPSGTASSSRPGARSWPKAESSPVSSSPTSI